MATTSTAPIAEGKLMPNNLEAANGTGPSVYKVAIVAPTPFYYQVPLFRAIAGHPRFDLEVYYCSKESLTAEDVAKRYKSASTWGDESELLEGYKYKFLSNYFPFGSYLRPIVGLLNPGVWKQIKDYKPDLVVLMSWMNPTWWLAVAACLFFKVPFVYLTDQNIQREPARSSLKTRIKSVFLGHFLFRLASGFLCAGTANREMYRYYGVPDGKLVPFAFSWGYETLLQAATAAESKKSLLRDELAIPNDRFVILFCGRLSPEKGLVTLLDAYAKVKTPGKTLAIVGDGPSRKTLEAYAAEKGIGPLLFYGFQNRSDISKFYVISDVLVLPSFHETWGLVVSESLCFGLPVITSDQVGASTDLVEEGHNGFTYPAGDVDALAEKLERLANLSEQERQTMGQNSRHLMERWSKRDLVESLDKYLGWMLSDKPTTDVPKSP